MKGKDHRALARYLLGQKGEGSTPWGGWRRRFFLVGCVTPDYIPLTYLRGFRQSRAMLGHHAKYSQARIRRTMGRLQAHGVRGLWDCFRLGTLMHYLSDSFTYPHTERFRGGMREHRRYEQGFHACFLAYLQRQSALTCPIRRLFDSLEEWLGTLRARYEASEQSFLSDCDHILLACSTVFNRLCGAER